MNDKDVRQGCKVRRLARLRGHLQYCKDQPHGEAMDTAEANSPGGFAKVPPETLRYRLLQHLRDEIKTVLGCWRRALIAFSVDRFADRIVAQAQDDLLDRFERMR